MLIGGDISEQEELLQMLHSWELYLSEMLYVGNIDREKILRILYCREYWYDAKCIY